MLFAACLCHFQWFFFIQKKAHFTVQQQFQYHSMIESWQQFVFKYSLDARYGVLIAPDYKASSFNFETLLKETLKIQQLQQDEEISAFLQGFPSLELNSPHNFEDLIIMHDFVNCLVNIYLIKKAKFSTPETEIKLPKNLAEPLYISTKQLGCQYGMGFNTMYNWIPLNDNHIKEDFSLGLQDIRLRFYLTENKEQELLFFGSVAIASIYLARIIKNLVEVQKIIEQRPNQYDQIVKRLSACGTIWQKIAEENKRVVRDFSAQYFYHDLRPYVRGFSNVVLQGVQNGKDLTVSTPGGTAGYDPSFQMFESAFGLQSKGIYQGMQIKLREGMPRRHVECIQYFKKQSLIRDYCSRGNNKVKEIYNRVVSAYGDFLRVHSEFIIRFIMNPAKKENVDENTIKGTAGTFIKEIWMRYENILSQKLK